MGEKQLKDLRGKEAAGKKLSDREKKRLERLDQWDKERNGKKREEEAIRKKEEEKRQLQEKANEAILEIKKKIDKLGLK